MTNKETVLKAMKAFFVDRDHTAIERYWHESYVQHNPSMINGHQGLRDLLQFIEPGFQWVPGIFIEVNDIVLAHSQVHGWGPAPLIVVDIFRFENGILYSNATLAGGSFYTMKGTIRPIK